MKALIGLLLVSSCFAAPNAPKKTQPMSKNEESIKKETANHKEPNALDKKPEDCDDKAKKPVDINADSINLSGTAGCTLDEAQP